MICKVTGNDCSKNKNGWCLLYKAQLKLVESCHYIDNKHAKTVFEKAVKNFGEVSQIDMLIEEMAELTQALSKYKRSKTHNVEEEVADVRIMLQQMEFIFDKEEIEKWYKYKKQRLAIDLEREDD